MAKIWQKSLKYRNFSNILRFKNFITVVEKIIFVGRFATKLATNGKSFKLVRINKARKWGYEIKNIPRGGE